MKKIKMEHIRYIMNKNCGIYKITSPSGRAYIGQSVNIRDRFNGYLKRYTKNKNQVKLHNSFEKYGVENHQFDIIEYCSEEDLNCSERFWQDEFDVLNNGLNCLLQNCGSTRRVVSKETRDKISKAIRGKKRTDGQKRQMSEARKGDKHYNFGKKFSEETRNKMSYAHKNKKLTEEHKKNLSIARKGENTTRSRVILDTQTGVYYFGAREASDSTTFNTEQLKSMLSGRTKNKTNLIVV